jgi:hypothetical protein
MTTVARKGDEGPREQQLDERVQNAWATYRESLRDLEGRDYEDVEHRSWDRLQRKLKQVADERATLRGATDSTRAER